MHGKYITSHGYVMIRVSAGHHLAMSRGYAYEHRIVMEQKIGRRLDPAEIVHHVNEDKSDNRPENLELVASNAEHKLRHRTDDSLRIPGEPNPTITCACGCGESRLKFDKAGRPRSFIWGHHGRVPSSETLAKLIAANLGKKRSEYARRRMREAWVIRKNKYEE